MTICCAGRRRHLEKGAADLGPQKQTEIPSQKHNKQANKKVGKGHFKKGSNMVLKTLECLHSSRKLSVHWQPGLEISSNYDTYQQADIRTFLCTSHGSSALPHHLSL